MLHKAIKALFKVIEGDMSIIVTSWKTKDLFIMQHFFYLIQMIRGVFEDSGNTSRTVVNVVK